MGSKFILVFALLATAAVAVIDIEPGQICGPDAKCKCKAKIGDSIKTADCEKDQFCHLKEEPVCINLIANQAECKSGDGCACGKTTPEQNVRQRYKNVCRKGDLCSSVGDTLGCYKTTIAQGQKCEGDHACRCTKMEMISFRNWDVICSPGASCLNENGWSWCVPQVITVDQKCEAQYCACNVLSSQVFLKGISVKQGGSCVVLENKNLTPVSQLLRGDQLCMGGECACQNPEVKTTINIGLQTVICTYGQKCAYDVTKQPMCISAIIETGDFCPHGSGCFCKVASDPTAESKICGLRQFCGVIDGRAECFSSAVTINAICRGEACMCYLGEVKTPQKTKMCLRDSRCVNEKGTLECHESDGSNQEGYCQKPGGCACHFDAPLIKEICLGKPNCVKDPASCKCEDATTDISTMCKKGQFCVADPNAPCDQPLLKPGEECKDPKSCICLNNPADPSKSNYADCELGWFCTGWGELAFCVKGPVKAGTECNDDACLCQNDQGDSVSCMKGGKCVIFEGKPYCPNGALSPSNVCADPDGCLCKVSRDSPDETICAKDQTCFEMDGKPHCSAKFIRDLDSCLEADGCLCQTTPLVGDDPLPFLATKCEKDQYCVTGFMGPLCKSVLEASSFPSQPIDKVEGDAFLVKLGDQIRTFRCVHTQTALFIEGEGVVCSNEQTTPIIIGHNDFCYAFKKGMCICYDEVAKSGEKPDEANCKVGQRCVIEPGSKPKCTNKDEMYFFCPAQTYCYCNAWSGGIRSENTYCRIRDYWPNANENNDGGKPEKILTPEKITKQAVQRKKINDAAGVHRLSRQLRGSSILRVKRTSRVPV